MRVNSEDQARLQREEKPSLHFHPIGGTVGTSILALMVSIYHTSVHTCLSPIRESASLINAGHAQYSTAFIVFLH